MRGPINLVFASGFLFPQRVFGRDYFRGVRAAFPGACFPRVPVVGSIEVRAVALAEAIAAFPFPDAGGGIHIVAHSMAGLDARLALHRDFSGLARRVASLSTIGTPHWGSPVADVLAGGGARRLVYEAVCRAMSALGLPAGALGELTTERARRFNREHPDIRGVRCYCYAGRRVEAYLLKGTGALVRRAGRTPDERDNDGLVSVASASWSPGMTAAEHAGTARTLAEPAWPTDHLGEVGRSLVPPAFASRFDHLAALRRVAERAAG